MGCRINRDGDRFYVDNDIESQIEEHKNKKLCPFRPKTTVFHNDRKNYMVPKHGINKMMNYDVHSTTFSPCIKEQCAAYDSITGKCQRLA